MYCPTCERMSANRRICPHCFNPYPTSEAPTAPGATARASGVGARAAGAAADARASAARTLAGLADRFRRQSPVVRWSAAGILLVLLLWAFTDPGEPAPARTGTRVAFDATPMSYADARRLLAQTRGTALVEAHADEVYVSFAVAGFPPDAEGRTALIRRYVRADEVVEGRRRRMHFYDPTGRMFAHSDGVTGVTVLR
jgi:hypothetical protein